MSWIEDIVPEAINDGKEQNDQPFQEGPNVYDSINTITEIMFGT